MVKTYTAVIPYNDSLDAVVHNDDDEIGGHLLTTTHEEVRKYGVKHLDRNVFHLFTTYLTDGLTNSFLLTRPPCIQSSAVEIICCSMLTITMQRQFAAHS